MHQQVPGKVGYRNGLVVDLVHGLVRQIVVLVQRARSEVDRDLGVPGKGLAGLSGIGLLRSGAFEDVAETDLVVKRTSLRSACDNSVGRLLPVFDATRCFKLTDIDVHLLAAFGPDLLARSGSLLH